MLKIISCFLFALLFSSSGFSQSAGNSAELFDTGWQFFKGGVERGQDPSIDDTHWRKVDLPHDWSIEDIGSTQSPFDSNAISQVGGGFTVGGTGWYRKTFFVPETQKGKRVYILFEGVYMNADIWLNGQHLGNHPYGYTSFWYDLSDLIKYGGKNLIAVQVKNEGQNSRWYSGSGIYRHVWLKWVNPVHFAPWGIQVSSSAVTKAKANLHISVTVRNQESNTAAVDLQTRVLDPNQREVGKWTTALHVVPGTGSRTSMTYTLQQPITWSVDSPRQYTLQASIYRNHQLVQRENTSFGIRSIEIDATRGLLLNGEPIKLKGGCYHNDNGPLGSKSYDRAEERRVELMKASGFNAIRCSHNPPPPAFLDACDRLGMLVIDEAFDMWKEGKTPYDYHLYFNDWWTRDIESMVLRDGNHPSVIMWSIGNEIPNRDKSNVVAVAKELADHIRALDPVRPITSAVNDVSDNKDPYFSVLDVAGYNYAADRYEPDHQRKPSRVMMGTESYALEAFEYWMPVVDHPYVIGDFIWTGFDYIGEASIGWRGYQQEKSFYPWNLAYCGDIDICGWKRPQSYYRDALWQSDQLALFVHPPAPSFPLNPKIESWSKWNWEDVVADWNWSNYAQKPLSVEVYSSCDAVELLINGKSLGRKPTNRATRFRASWDVPWQAGELKAIGYSKGKLVQQRSLFSTGEPTHISLSADRNQIAADGEDLSYVVVELLDANGHLDPKAENLVQFSVEGPATIVGVGNANPVSLESYQLPQRKAWRGKCLVVLKSTGTPGDIVLHASAAGLPSASLRITAGSK
ncbi:MAG TPA: glycoside hydrolase family 2 TIM barrel-domain containing protein [Puia sp.]|nr:glycoside hydrolase family 2 TIM barrel-domain containing protein [Puia sp.]